MMVASVVVSALAMVQWKQKKGRRRRRLRIRGHHCDGLVLESVLKNVETIFYYASKM